MNWLGIDIVEVLAALVGAMLGAAADALARARGLDAPWLVGLGAGAFAAVVARRRSRTRGLIVGTLAVWIAAGVDRWRASGGLLHAMIHLHESITAPRLAAFAVTGLLAVILGAASIRRRAPLRRAGT